VIDPEIWATPNHTGVFSPERTGSQDGLFGARPLEASPTTGYGVPGSGSTAAGTPATHWDEEGLRPGGVRSR
jgi:hypothetical protein